MKKKTKSKPFKTLNLNAIFLYKKQILKFMKISYLKKFKYILINLLTILHNCIQILFSKYIIA